LHACASFACNGGAAHFAKEALKNQATFVGWDFETVWQMGANGPELRK
jgi:hypothetical protein